MIADRGSQPHGDDESADEGDPRVVAAAQEYLAAIEAGKPLDQQQFLARYPEIAAGLAECLQGLELVHAAANAIRKSEISQQPATPRGQVPLPLGDFRLLREIGRGGMGIVYEAIQLSLGRRVAVKILPFATALDPKHLQRFKNESQAAAQLHHTNIVPVYAVGSARGVHFYAMQLIDGEPLSSLIEHLRQLNGKPSSTDGRSSAPNVLATELAAGRFAQQRGSRGHAETEPLAADPTPPSAATSATAGSSTLLAASHGSRPVYFRTIAHLMRQTAAALEHAHELGIIHRDIKPANLILDRRGNIWVTDFGLAQFQGDANLTRTGDMMGTLRYMSPEQAAGNRVVLDHRTDIYSLGVTLYESLTLEPVFTDNIRHDLLRRIVEDEPRAPRQLDSSIPIELETIVLKAIAKAPQERYATAQDMADDLQRFLDDKPILARRPTLVERAARWRRRHRSVVVSAVALLVLASLGLLGATIVISREHSKTKTAYFRESLQREAAEESFRQAREAVDGFTQLAEEELASRPMMQPLRRKFLELTVGYYRNFLQQRQDDPDPSVRADLAATSQRVADIVDELDALQRFAPLMLLSDDRVQQDLNLSSTATEAIDTLLLGLAADADQDDEHPASLAATQHRVAELLRSTEKEIVNVLSVAQRKRLEQIAWQQRGPFAFESAEVVAALELTTEQRTQIAAAIEQDRPGPRDRGPGGPGDHGPGNHGPGGPQGRGPGGPGDYGRGPDDFGRRPDPPPDGFGPRQSGGERLRDPRQQPQRFDGRSDSPPPRREREVREQGDTDTADDAATGQGGSGESGGPPRDADSAIGHQRRPGFGPGRGFEYGPGFDERPSADRGFGFDRGPGHHHGPPRGGGRLGPPPKRHSDDDGDQRQPPDQFDRAQRPDAEGSASAPDERLSEGSSDESPRRRAPPPDRPQGPRREPPPQARRAQRRHTVEKILLLLTPEQRAKWRDMTGEPFAFDLHWRFEL